MKAAVYCRVSTKDLYGILRSNTNTLIEKLKQEKTSGQILDLTPIKISPESIDAAVKESLKI